MFDENKTCANCAYWRPDNQSCVLLKARRAENDYCSSHSTSPLVCATCQSYILGKSFIYSVGNAYVEVCEKCHTAIPTCAGCKNSVQCAFNDDPNPLPKIVMQTVQQGNMMMQTQVRNPERIKLFCENCPCYNAEDRACDRECNVCAQYNCIFDP